jgi:hypothetical protein
MEKVPKSINVLRLKWVFNYFHQTLKELPSLLNGISAKKDLKPRVQSANLQKSNVKGSKSKKQAAFMQAENMLKHLLNECQDILRDSTLVDESKQAIIVEQITSLEGNSSTISKDYNHEIMEESYEMNFHSLKESQENLTRENFN